MNQNNEHVLAGKFDVADKILSLMNLKEKNKQLMLNITGTILSKDSNGISYYPSLYKQVFAHLQNGQTIENGYKMEKGELTSKPLATETSEKKRTLDLLKGIQQKLANDAPFTEEEKQLLGSTRFPVGTFIAVMSHYKGSGSALVLERYSELLSYDRVMQFMEEAVSAVLQKAESFRAAQIGGFELEEYIQQVQRVSNDLKSLKEEHRKTVIEEQKALESLLQIDQKLRADLSRSSDEKIPFPGALPRSLWIFSRTFNP